MGMRSGKALRATKTKKAARKTRRAAPKAKRAKPAPKRASSTRRAPAPPRDPLKGLRELAQRIVDLTVAGDDEGAFALYADDVESMEMGMPPSFGMDAIRQKFAMWRGMVRDSIFRPRRVWVDDSAIVIEWEGKVTLAASGATVDMLEVAVHEIENGKIVRERFYYNPAVLQQ